MSFLDRLLAAISSVALSLSVSFGNICCFAQTQEPLPPTERDDVLRPNQEPNNSQTSANSKQLGRLPLNIQLEEQEGYQTTIETPEGAPGDNRGLLVSINGIDLQGKPLEEIRNLLRAPTDSSAKIELLKADGTLQSILLKAVSTQSPALLNSRSYAPGLMTIYLNELDGARTKEWPLNFDLQFDSPITDNLDLLVQANNRIILNYFTVNSFGTKPPIAFLATKAMLRSQELGNVPATREFTQLLLKNLDLKSVKPSVIEHGYLETIDMCLSTGRSDESLAICQKLLDSLDKAKPNNYDSPKDQIINLQIAFLKSSVRAALLKNDRTQASAFLDKLFEIRANPDYDFSPNDSWLGEHYLQRGNYQRALVCFKAVTKRKEEQASKISNNIDRNLFTQQQSASLYYNLGLTYQKLGNNQEAIRNFQKALSFDKLLLDRPNSNVNLDNLERLTAFSPTPCQIKLSLCQSYLDEGKAKEAAELANNIKQQLTKLRQSHSKRLKQTLELLALAKDNLNEKGEASRLRKEAASIVENTSPLPQSPAQHYKEIETIYQEIDSGNLATATSAISLLLELAKNESPYCGYPGNSDSARINTFTSLLSISRHLSDRHFLKEADDLLDQLEKLVMENDLEKVDLIFTGCEKAINAKRAQRQSESIWTSVQSQLASLQFAPGESFRKIAKLYASAGEFERANVLLEHASRQNDITTPQNQAARQNQILFFLDKAYLDLYYKNYTEAQSNYAKARQLLIGLGQDSDTNNALTFNSIYRSKVSDLAHGFLIAGKDVEAEHILTETLKLIANHTPCLQVNLVSGSNNENNSNVNSILEESLAILLFQQKRTQEALPYLNMVISTRDGFYPPFYQEMRAQCLEAAGCFSEAANDYLATANSGYATLELNEASSQYDYHEQLLRKALICSMQAKNLSAEKKGAFYLALASFLEQTDADRKEILALYRQGYKLLPDSNNEKIRTASQIATIESITYDETQPNKEASATLTPNAESLKMEEEAALIAEKQEPTSAGMLWLTLANSQAQAKLLDKALVSARRAISHFHPGPLNISTFIGLPAPDSEIIFQLSANNRGAEAESLLLAAEEIYRKHPPAARSGHYAYFLTQFIRYYLDQSNYEKANAKLMQLLSFDPRKTYFDQAPGRQAIEYLLSNISDSNTDSEKQKIHKNIRQSILKNQLQYFAADDYRIAYILLKIADSEYAGKNYMQAEKYYEQVLAISKLYGYEQTDDNPVWQKLTESLKALGKQPDVDKIRTRIQKAHQLREKLANFSSFNRSRLELKEFYSWVQEVAPYSGAATSCCEALLEEAEVKKDWPEVAKLAREGLNKVFHGCELITYANQDIEQPFRSRFRYYKSLLEAYLAMNQKEQANQVLKEVQAGQSYNPSIEELVFLASISDIGGDKENALNYCKEAREQRKIYSCHEGLSNDLERLWQSLTVTENSSGEQGKIYCEPSPRKTTGGTHEIQPLKETTP